MNVEYVEDQEGGLVIEELGECFIMAAVVQQNDLVFEFASNVMEDEQQGVNWLTHTADSERLKGKQCLAVFSKFSCGVWEITTQCNRGLHRVLRIQRKEPLTALRLWESVTQRHMGVTFELDLEGRSSLSDR
ncbi:ETS-related transcription factor Elf-1 [Camelus dromedarius]|uniref:ETS-related transcription factor Elf-1 n=1 Tax=Camelus dromedarius TaxID=9838 RepID=A0A5N4DA44_CAMDR|nr:ETS-related transcription factor Elf-1 [Camelus dromedarius]